MKVCAQPGCPNLVSSGSRCPLHQRIPWVNSSPYKLTDAMRKSVLAEDPICRICGVNPSTRVDHIVSRAEGGSDERGNLRGICYACDKKRIGQQAAIGRKRKQEENGV